MAERGEAGALCQHLINAGMLVDVPTTRGSPEGGRWVLREASGGHRCDSRRCRGTPGSDPFTVLILLNTLVLAVSSMVCRTRAEVLSCSTHVSSLSW